MSISNAQYIAWLTDPKAIRIVLIEAVARVAGTETTFYLSTGNYVTGAGETPAHQPYLPMALANVSVTESLSLTNEASMSIGDVEIHNLAGERDAWLGYVWVNRPIQAFIGDPRWARADFRMIFNGIVADIGSKSRDKLNLKLRDKLQRLNTAVTEVKVKDVITNPTLATLSNKDAIFPISLGEQHNITPLLTDPATLEYTYHYGAAGGVIEPRDNGVPVGFTETPATGKFKLTASPAGAVTVSVQGDKTGGIYVNTISTLVQRLVTNYGKSTDRFTSADLDATNLAAFDTAHPQPVGTFLGDRTNVLTACQQLAVSVGAQIAMSRLGLLRLFQIDLSAPVSTFTIGPAQMVDRNLTITTRTDVVAAVKLGFCKNWTMQPGLQTTLSAADKELFDTEWLTSTQVDATVQSTYKLTADPVQIDTCLLRRTDADAEATRQLNLKKVSRAVYQFEGFAEMLQLELGQIVTIKHPRFNLAAGGVGMVISLSPNWANGHVTVGVLI